MHRSYAPTTDDIDNFRFAASARVSDLLRGELELDIDFDNECAAFEDDVPLAA